MMRGTPDLLEVQVTYLSSLWRLHPTTSLCEWVKHGAFCINLSFSLQHVSSLPIRLHGNSIRPYFFCDCSTKLVHSDPKRTKQPLLLSARLIPLLTIVVPVIHEMREEASHLLSVMVIQHQHQKSTWQRQTRRLLLGKIIRVSPNRKWHLEREIVLRPLR